ncbi:MAG: tRNA (adenosine(37)-N6)-threonylcarbamoyltransferase complex ATPase subunit type 1 TsaE [Desulfobulbaceae bacterium]|nr:tRNA (adenosine(37)-N6)-threonylcarbamoyltransferase complex ATPase subunit type 1 TsaE [Desulfobulbaceae bacterium]
MTTNAIVLASLAETIDFGRQLGRIARPGDIITMTGNLGAGKTTLTQAIGQGLQVPEECYITSPTFSLLHEYPGRIPLYHMDLYRLADEEEIEVLGFEDYLYGEGLCVIEWPERLGSLMPTERLHIDLRFAGETARRAELTGYGDGWRARIPALLAPSAE